MPKATSSASSATRKKHARKQAAKHGSDDDEAAAAPSPQTGQGQVKKQQPLQRGEKKKKGAKGKEPKKKVYVPPPKPPKGLVDPVDLYGLGVVGASPLPPELVVVLRMLVKRSENTIAKAVEDLDSWVRRVIRDGGEGVDQVMLVIPVWMHHFPRLSAHPSRRIRLLTASLMAFLVAKSSPVRSEVLSPVHLEQPDVVGAWCAAAFDVDRAVRTMARRTWDDIVDLAPISDDGAVSDGRLSLATYAPEIVDYLAAQLPLPEPIAKPLPTGKGKAVPAPTPAIPADETDEDPLGKHSRLATGALDALAYLASQTPTTLKSSLFEGLFSSDDFWPRLDVRVDELPLVRRALWTLLAALLHQSAFSELIESILSGLAQSTLHAAFAERDGAVQAAMWEPLLLLLKAYSAAWSLSDSVDHDDDSSSSSEEDEDVTAELGNDADEKPTTHGNGSSTLSPIVLELFAFLQVACRGNGASYPAIVVLLSTMPNDVLLPKKSTGDGLFASFWAAFDGRALDGQPPTALRAFFTAVIECSVLFANRLRAAGDEEAAATLVVEQCERVWRELIGLGQLSLTRAEPVISSIAEALLMTENKRKKTASLAPAMGQAALEVIEGEDDTLVKTLPRLGKALTAMVHAPIEGDDPSRLPVELVALVFSGNVDRLAAGENIHVGRLALVEALLADEKTRSVCLTTPAIEQIDTLVAQRLASSEDPVSFTFLLRYLALRGSDTTAIRTAWTAFANSLAESSGLLASPRLVALLAAHGQGQLPDGLPQSMLGAAIRACVTSAIDGKSPLSEAEGRTLALALASASPIIPDQSRDLLLESISKAFAGSSQTLLYTTVPISPSLSLMAALTTQITLMKRLAASSDLTTGVAALYETAELARDASIRETATQAWQRALVALPGSMLPELALSRLNGFLVDEDDELRTDELLLAMQQLGQSNAKMIDTFLGSSDSMRSALLQSHIASPSPSLAAFEPLIQSNMASIDRNAARKPSVFVRRALAGVQVLSTDRSLAREVLWSLPHVQLLSILAADELAVRGSSVSMLGSEVTASEVQAIMSVCDALLVSALSSAATAVDAKWHETTIARLRSAPVWSGESDLTSLLVSLAAPAEPALAAYNVRAFGKLLSGVMRYSDAGPPEAERWLAFAQTLQKSNASLGLAIIYSVRDWLFEAPRFQRYQNELASSLSAVPPSAASTTGVALLRYLIATAPSSESDALFLPQQRTIFLLQSLQKWFAADDDDVDLSDEVHALLAELFVGLAPIVQDRTGAHWDFFFDVIESNVETASWKDPSSLPGLYQSLRLLSSIADLSSTNRDLRDHCKTRFAACLEMVRKLVFSSRDRSHRSEPAAAALRLGLELVASLPALSTKSIDIDVLVVLLQEDDAYARQISYGLARQAIEMQVKDLVVEVELASADALPAIILPPSLLELAGKSALHEEGDQVVYHLLAWLLIFEYFGHASFQVRAAYLDQLRRTAIFENAFLPAVFSLTGVSERIPTLDLTPWSFEDPALADLDEHPLTPALLASHAYLRALQAVPSLIRHWWESLRDRQYSMSVASFTAKHFSPLLIAREMSHVAAADLSDDDLSVKISTTGTEVKAVYTIDEVPLELSIRLPSEYPLVAIEVKDSRKVGVTEGQWRGWILAVQQTIMAQNGLIADALALFKRNVALHFEGVEPCAICYSIISVVDRTTPVKKCATCSNKYHSSCLYKWFSTSSGSTCPLCRAIWQDARRAAPAV